MAGMSEGPEKPQPRWFQFTVRRMLAATFWAAVCFGLCCYLPNAGAPQSELGERLQFFGTCLIGLSPFIAVGTLAGRPWTGLFVGLAAFLIPILILMVAIAVGFAAGWIVDN